MEPDSLHDFRVGLRRLRSTVSAYRNQLRGSVTGKMRKQLGRLARATNEGRDTEVQLAWLSRQAEHPTVEAAQALYWLAGRLESRKEEIHGPATATIARRYEKVATKLRRALGVLRIELDSGRSQRLETFGEVAGELVRQHVTRLQNDLSRIAGPSEPEQVHRARIDVKRLRYLLEPIARRTRRAAALVRRLKEAQDLLGEYHDLHVLAVGIRGIQSGLPANSLPGLQQGLATLVSLAEEEALTAFDRFQSLWGSQLASRILRRADELGASLVQHAETPSVNDTPALTPAAIADQPIALEPEPQVMTEAR
jgi:CHAD domain-containing protein